MNFQNHYYNIAQPMYDTVSPLSQGFRSMRQPHNCRPRSENNIGHTFIGYSDCQTPLCTVQFFNRYWEGTDINTQVVFLSNGREINKFCYWNYHKNTNSIMIMDCNYEVTDSLQVSCIFQVFINFHQNHDSNP